MIVGVLYGDKSELSGNYKNIDKTCPVYCGAEFWEHLTGDRQFYHRLAKAFGEVVEEGDTEGKRMVLQMVDSLAKDIESYVEVYGVKTA